MAYGDETASRRPNRLTRRRPRSGLAHDLAEDLLTTEYGLRDYHRRNGARRTPGLWGDLWDGFRRVVDRVLGRSRPAPGGGGYASGDGGYAPDGEGYVPGGGPEGGAYGQGPLQRGGQPAPATVAEPTWRSSSEQSALERMSELERFVHGLSDVQRTAFEDEVLRRVRADDKWKKVHDRYPQRMPAMMTYANNAYLREVGHPARPPAVPPEMQEVRSRWERPASRRQPGVPDVTGVSYPGVNEMSDGLAFREAARVTREWGTVGSRGPAQDPMSDAVAFNAVRDAAVARLAADTEPPAPLSAPDPFEEAARVTREWGTVGSRGPAQDPMSDAVAFNAVRDATVARVTAPSETPTPASASDPFQEAERVEGIWRGEPDSPVAQSLISDKGHQVLHEQESLRSRSDSTSKATPAPRPASHIHTRPTSPAPRGR